MQNLLHNSGKFGLLPLSSLQIRIIFCFTTDWMCFRWFWLLVNNVPPTDSNGPPTAWGDTGFPLIVKPHTYRLMISMSGNHRPSGARVVSGAALNIIHGIGPGSTIWQAMYLRVSCGSKTCLVSALSSLCEGFLDGETIMNHQRQITSSFVVCHPQF